MANTLKIFWIKGSFLAVRLNLNPHTYEYLILISTFPSLIDVQKQNHTANHSKKSVLLTAFSTADV